MLTTPFLLAQKNNTISKTKTSNSLKITKLIFAFYFFHLLGYFQHVRNYIINIFFVFKLSNLGMLLRV